MTRAAASDSTTANSLRLIMARIIPNRTRGMHSARHASRETRTAAVTVITAVPSNRASRRESLNNSRS